MKSSFSPVAIILALSLGFAAVGSMAADAKDNLVWLDTGKTAFSQAKKEKKPILLDFTGSTWCPSCIALHKEVFATKKFEDYSKKFVLLKVDFPNPYSAPQKGADLVDRYLKGDVMLPTILVLSPDGKMLGATSYQPGGPDPFIGAVDKIAKANGY